MLKNYKYSLIFLIIVFLFFLSTGFCFAREIEIPLPGLPAGAEPVLQDYIKVLFSLGMRIAGAIAVLALVIGGLRYMISAGNPTAISEAKKTIFGALFGMVLLFSSYLILTTINPELIELKIEPTAQLPGIYLTRGDSKEPSPSMVSDVGKIGPYDTIKWFSSMEGVQGCVPNDPKEGVYLVYFYQDSDFKRIERFDRLVCGGSVSINKKTFRIIRERPGVYFYPSGNLGVDPERIPMAYSKSIPEWDSDIPIKSIRIVNGPDEHKGPFYGVIFHSGLDYTGASEYKNYLFSKVAGYNHEIKNVNFGEVMSITIYKWVGFRKSGLIASAGDGVTFYSKRNWKGGYRKILDSNITDDPNPTTPWPLKQRPFDYTGTGVKEDEQKKCKYIIQCPGSMKIDGSYLVLLEAETAMYVTGWGAAWKGQRFPISERLAMGEEYKEKYEGLDYDTKRGSIDLKMDWIGGSFNWGVNLTGLRAFIIPLAEEL